MEVDIQQFQSCHLSPTSLTADSFRRFFSDTSSLTLHNFHFQIQTLQHCISISTSSDANAFSIRKTHFSTSQPQAAAIRNPSGPRFEATARSSQRLWPCTGPPALPCGLRGPKSDLLGAVSIGDEPNLGELHFFEENQLYPAVKGCENGWFSTIRSVYCRLWGTFCLRWKVKKKHRIGANRSSPVMSSL